MSWVREPGIRLRPVPEQECCLAYRPADPRAAPPRPAGLYALNLSSWLVLTLCDGRPEPAIAEEFIAAMPAGSEHAASRAALVVALAELRTFGLASQKGIP